MLIYDSQYNMCDKRDYSLRIVLPRAPLDTEATQPERGYLKE
jgi:hypothetical protein